MFPTFEEAGERHLKELFSWENRKEIFSWDGGAGASLNLVWVCPGHPRVTLSPGHLHTRLCSQEFARDAQSHFVGKTFGAVGRKSAMTEFHKNHFQRGNWITSVRVLGRSGTSTLQTPLPDLSLLRAGPAFLCCFPFLAFVAVFG